MTTASVGRVKPSGPSGEGGPAAPGARAAVAGLGLAPLREALLARARSTAADLVGAARAERDRAVAEAEREVAELLEGSRAQGQADGEELLAADRATARAADRARLLAAQHTVYESLREACRRRVHDLLAQSGAREHLATAVLRRLDADAADATVKPTPDGGLTVCTSDGRTVDASVSALVDSALARQDLARLWSPE